MLDHQPLIARAGEALGGPLTLLVNNASIFEHDTIDTATRSSWDRHMESNLRAPFVLTQEFAKQAPKAQADAKGEPVAQGACGEYARSTRAQAYARFHELHPSQNGAMGFDTNRSHGPWHLISG